MYKKKKKKPLKEPHILRIWEAWPAEWLDPFRTPKQIEEARRRRKHANIAENPKRSP